MSKMRLLGVLAAALAALPAHAALVVGDGWVAGDQHLTLDTDTGLQWLDLDVTNDMSIEAFNSGVGGLLGQGFALATRDQVATLFAHSGAVSQGNTLTAEATPAVTLLFDTLGCTTCRFFDLGLRLPTPYEAYEQGYGEGSFVLSGGGYSWGYFELFADGTGRLYADDVPQLGFGHHQRGAGIFLTRTASAEFAYLTGADPTPSFDPLASVPEPAAWALMIIGFALIGATLRMRRTEQAQDC
jgi:hypothetical protein